MPRPIRAGCFRQRSLWTSLITYFSITGVRPLLNVNGESMDLVKVSAVVGGDAVLPCETIPKSKTDVLQLVVWYKNNKPLYSFDGRKDSSEAHWADAALAGRGNWHAAQPSRLRIQNVLPTDRAVYQCRVDFKLSPTKNYKVMLEVIELPEKPKVFDESDTEIVSVAGPYTEDKMDFKLTCIVSGGKPMPRLRWWRDDKVITSLAPLTDETQLSVLELKIPKLTRDYFEAIYTCTADNTLLVPPVRAIVQIQMYLRPMFVEFLPREQPLTVDQPADLGCRAVGARPPAVISWWLDDRQLRPTTSQKETEDNNETVSYLRWTPRMEDNHRRLTCRAMHVFIEDTTIETSVKLNLHYPPNVTLQFGAKLNPNDIEEGDDVYFQCNVDSYPPAYKVVWEHNGQILSHNQRAGVIAGSAHLALQSAKKHHAGVYVCIASNVEGDGRSEPVNLEILYKPECVMTMTALVGVALNEPTTIICEVEGYPPPRNFQWLLNNSIGTIEIDSEKYSFDENGRSVLSYTPLTDRDYGTLSCRATNLAGQQVQPCRYHLVPGVRPDPLNNCTYVNPTQNSAEIKCIAGYDGGMPTSYFVEVWDVKKTIANISTAAPSWLLRGLGKGKQYKLKLYSHNARGRSDAISLVLNTLDQAPLNDKDTTNSGVDVWVLVIIFGLAGTFVIIVIVTIVVRKKGEPAIEYAAPLHSVKADKDDIDCADNSPTQPDDKNPDVVPLGKGNSDFNTVPGQRPPEPPPYGAVMAASVPTLESAQSLSRQDQRSWNGPTAPPAASERHNIVGPLADNRQRLSSGTYHRRREIVTTKTPLLSNTRESRV